MSTVPTPPHIPRMSEDWSNDPSFDLDSSRPIHAPASPPTPTSSISSTRSRISFSSHSSAGSSGVHTSSPLRQSVTSPANDAPRRRDSPAEDGFDDFDFDDPPRRVRTSSKLGQGSGTLSKPSSGSFKNLQGVSTPHHSGVGTITKLQPKAKKLSPEAVRSKVKGVSKDWEGDFDFAPLSPSLASSAAKIKSGRGTLPRGLNRNQLGLEDDMDGFGDDDFGVGPSGGGTAAASDFGAALKAKLAKSAEKPGVDAFGEGSEDDFGDAFEEDEATIKAGDTMKARLPPPRTAPSNVGGSSSSRIGSGRDAESNAKTVKPAKSASREIPSLGRASNVTRPAPVEDDFEADFDFPTGDLKLVPHAHQPARSVRNKPRTSTSTVGSVADWDSPQHSKYTKSTPDSTASRGGWGTDDSSPGYRGKRGVNYETSATSITSATSSASITTPRDKSVELWDDDDDFAPGGSVRRDVDDDEIGGIVFGAVLKRNDFAERQRAVQRKRAEDSKREEEELARLRAHRMGHRRDGTDETNRTTGSTSTGGGGYIAYPDESMEDGFDKESLKSELPKQKLRQARSQTPSSTRKGNAGSFGRRTLESGLREPAEKDSWFKERERGWNRPAQSALALSGLGSLRSQSATGQPGFANLSRRAESPASLNKPRTSLNAIPLGSSTGVGSMPPPPIPPSTPHRALKSQKSMHHLAQSPTHGVSAGAMSSGLLSKKQSMPSLRGQPARPSSTGLTGGSSSAFASTSASAHTPGMGMGMGGIEGLPDRNSRHTQSTSRLKFPTASSQAKAKSRPKLPHHFTDGPVPSGSANSLSSVGYGGGGLSGLRERDRERSGGGSIGRRGGQLVVARGNRREADMDELDRIEDLETDEVDVVSESAGGSKKGSLGRKKGLGKIKEDVSVRDTRDGRTSDVKGKAKSSGVKGDGKGSIGRSKKVRPGLIQPMNKSRGVVCKLPNGMSYDPARGVWEGNEADLERFTEPSPQPSRYPTSVRPARIIPLTTIGPNSTAAAAMAARGAARIVGDMRFDEDQGVWYSNLPPEEDEPDPFAGWGDDDDGDDEGGGGGTIRARDLGIGKTGVSGLGRGMGGGGGRLASESSVSTVSSVRDGDAEGMRLVSGLSALSTSAGSVGGYTGYGGGVGAAGGWAQGGLVSDELVRESKEAARRHAKEWRYWTPEGLSDSDRRERERERLWRYWDLAQAAQGS